MVPGAGGAKGERRGDIHVADYHANLIYNTGAGTAAGLCAPIADLKARVRAKFGIEIEEESSARRVLGPAISEKKRAHGAPLSVPDAPFISAARSHNRALLRPIGARAGALDRRSGALLRRDRLDAAQARAAAWRSVDTESRH